MQTGCATSLTVWRCGVRFHARVVAALSHAGAQTIYQDDLHVRTLNTRFASGLRSRILRGHYHATMPTTPTITWSLPYLRAWVRKASVLLT
jgi:hypothetical protein